jgi:tripartite-type tricarboxylate transporter receptor subunit TctC
MNMKRRAVLGAMLALGLADRASAQAYPTRPIKLVVPFTPGGVTDNIARVFCERMGRELGQQFIIDNRAGANGRIGTDAVAKSAPDGYTLLLHNLQITANVTLYKSLPFDTEKDLTLVMLVNKNPLILVGRNTLEPNNWAELHALMKKQTLKAAIPGYGATGHLTTTLLAQEAKISLDQIPYRGAAPAMTDLLGGHVDLFIGTPQSIVPQVLAGKLKAFGVTSKEPPRQLPKVESLVKALGPKFDIIYWQALFAPSGTPEPIIKQLNAALQAVVTDPALAQKWENEGFDAFPKDQLTLQAGRTFVHSEVERWGAVIRDNNIKVSQQ